MKIALERRSALGLGITSIHTSLLVVTVAGVPCCSMLRPWTCGKSEIYIGPMKNPHTHAHPTELVFAFLASHMARIDDTLMDVLSQKLAKDILAAAILLNRALTFAALFRVALDPISRLTVVLALL